MSIDSNNRNNNLPAQTRGYATIRNADGTQWYSQFGFTPDYDERISITLYKFETELKPMAEESLKRGGDYAAYNLKFHPLD